jgi:hypothetical protein
LLICRFQQPRPQFPMYLDVSTNDLLGQGIPFTSAQRRRCGLMLPTLMHALCLCASVVHLQSCLASFGFHWATALLTMSQTARLDTVAAVTATTSPPSLTTRTGWSVALPAN